MSISARHNCIFSNETLLGMSINSYLDIGEAFANHYKTLWSLNANNMDCLKSYQINFINSSLRVISKVVPTLQTLLL